jgi:hypothetical protein
VVKLLLATAVLWVQIQTFLKNTKKATSAKKRPKQNPLEKI